MTEQQKNTNQLLQQVRKDLSIGRKKQRYTNRSALYPVTAEIMRLNRMGASLKEIQFYLQYKHHLHITVRSRTTIKNYIDKVRSQTQSIDEVLF